MEELLKEHGLNRSGLRLHLRAYKEEKVLELWAKNASDTLYQKVREYDICALSGNLGPKRQQGDRQIPEGFYHIDRFNPYSKYHLSLGLNYPNPSDRILGVEGDLGGNIFVHGSCVTIGCLPITDPLIKELYIFCVEARDKGQKKIPVRIFPARMDQVPLEELLYRYEGTDPPKGLWKELRKADKIFSKKRRLARVDFLDNGRHRIERPDR
ncbi:MAG: murein L,D-transpeptidase family protein [Flavobacteriales bacterium]